MDYEYIPSPGATPTNTSHSFSTNNGFQTPKATGLPSHFQDAFTTPQMPTFASPRQPEYTSTTPTQWPSSSSETLQSNYYAQMQASGGHAGVQGMPHPGHTTQAPGMNPYGAHPSQQYQVSSMSFDSAHMQTPPPTRGISVKKPQPEQFVAFGTPSTIASRRFLSPQHAYQPSPDMASYQPADLQYPQLHFSPNMYAFGNVGPASAPVVPQSQLLWEPTNSPDLFNAPNALDDPFAPATSGAMDWPVAPPQYGNAQAVAFDTPAMGSFPIQPPHPRPASATQFATNTMASFPEPRASINPSLVYSSPIRPPMPASGRTNQAPENPLQLSTQRKDSGVANRDRLDTASSAQASLHTNMLRRSNTTGGTRPQSNLPAMGGDVLGFTHSALQVTRTASPLKRIGRPALGSISESRVSRPRTSVVLTIDANGRARTETKRLDDSPTRLMRDRYPGLYDSDTSDEESDNSEQTPSRTASFSFSKSELRKSKVAKLESPVENLEGLSIPRSSSAASMKVTPSRAAIAAAAQLRRSGSLRKKTPSRNSQRRLTSSATSLIDTCPMDSIDHSQSITGAETLAHHALPESFQAQDWAGSTLDAHNRRWSMMSLEQQQYYPQNISPSHHLPNSHLARANPRRPVRPARQVRCTCGVAEDQGQLLVQCGLCTQWSHAPCIGADATTLPPAFTCFLCTKPPQGRR